MQQLTTVILAAGEGKRMRSRTPKMLHQMCGRPLIAYPLRLAQTLSDRVVMVVGPWKSDNVRAVVGADVAIAEQLERLGTGHAVLQARSACPAEGVILVLAGDMPLLSLETLERLVQHHRATGAVATVLTAVVERPQGLRARATAGRAREAHRRGPGRHGRREEGHRDQHQRLLLRRAAAVARAGRARPDNDQGEFYLTDVVGLLARAGGAGGGGGRQRPGRGAGA